MDSNILATLRKARGFTLIELLIVIAIIAILSVAFLPTLRGGQAGARNAARKAAVSDIILAVERIANGDIPAGVALTTATAGAIPLSAGACLDFTVANSLAGDIRQILGNNPALQPTNTTLCGGGYWYKSFPAVGTANNYVVVTQVELPVSNGNVSGAQAIAPDAPGANLNIAGNLDTWANTLARTTGTATQPFWALTK